jgi:hypothetical protein
MYLTEENMETRVKSVVIHIPSRPSTIPDGRRKESQVIIIKPVLGK